MADVRLSIAGREYIVTCKDGEEARLTSLGAMVDEKAREAGGPAGGLNESRLLLFSALLLADKLHDADHQSASTSAEQIDIQELTQAADAMERLAERIERLVQRLEN
ncbi:MAG: cell division protein ZapA [Sphingorhabdus sp.]